MKTSRKVRLDQRVVSLGICESRERARALIMAGQVKVDGRVVDKASTLVSEGARIEGESQEPYVSRGGYKLAKALDTFPVRVEGKVALDAGASTGGFTDVLLQRGASKVYAVDVGYGQLHWKLRQNARVVPIERTNIRYLESLPERVQIVTSDLSFISLILVLERLGSLAEHEADFILLIKPQFEAGREQVGRGGVVRDSSVHRDVLLKVGRFAERLGLRIQGVVVSPVLGPAGNVEFLSWLSRMTEPPDSLDQMVERAISEAAVLTKMA